MADSNEAATAESEKDLRLKKIATAIKFLQNPRVRATAMTQRRAFLEKKGLTKDEIDEAIEKSGTAADEQNVPAPLPIASYQQGPPIQSVVPVPMPSHSWRGYVGAAILGGSLGYIIVKFFKQYIVPLITSKGSKDDRLQRIETSVTDLSTGILETVGGVQTTLNSVQDLLLEQQKKIICLSADLSTTQEKVALLPNEMYSVGDLKTEISSLKGLLLNRKQFPSPLTGSTPAGIPSWQRAVTAGADSSTTSSASTSTAASKRNPSGGQTTNVGTGHPKMNEMETQNDHSTTNGETHSPRSSDSNRNTPNKSHDLSSERSRTSSASSDTDTPNTVKDVSSSEKNMDDALLADTGDISMLSTDTSVSSLSDMSANASFNEASIAFSSTCIKIPSEASKEEETANESALDSVE